jgi:hypothetical protein
MCFFFFYTYLFILTLVYKTTTELVVLDSVLNSTAWCINKRCHRELTGIFANVTNECLYHSDCVYISTNSLECGLFNYDAGYISTSELRCEPLGAMGKKYCTMGCRLFRPPDCHNTGDIIDPTWGTIAICVMYYDTITTNIVPICPCHRKACDISTVCTLPDPYPTPPEVFYILKTIENNPI